MQHTKTIFHNKTPLNKILLEIELQKYVSENYDFCPKILSVEHFEDKTNITMEKLQGLSLAEKYSDNPSDIPSFVWTQIHYIISSLFYNEGIEYIDISSYNFMIVKDKVYIIDFGHAYWCNENKQIKNWFLKDFIEDEINEFNPDFF